MHLSTVRRDLAHEYEQARSDLADALAGLQSRLPELRRGDGADLWDGATVTVSDLIRAGLVELQDGELAWSAARSTPSTSTGSSAPVPMSAAPRPRAAPTASTSRAPAFLNANFPSSGATAPRFVCCSTWSGRPLGWPGLLSDSLRSREGLSAGDLEPGGT